MTEEITGIVKDKRIALYGLGTETQRLISESGDGLNVVGLLDGFKESGEMFGYPIISLDDAIKAGAETILVVARPGSCRIIAKRIKDKCIKNQIAVIDVRGNDLLKEDEIKYDYSGIKRYRKADLLAAIDSADVVSFDLFDTLIARKVYYYTDIFELIEKENGFLAGTNFSKMRLAAEKELSVLGSPTLIEIYKHVLAKSSIAKIAEELAGLEWLTDRKTMALREGMKEIVTYAKERGKRLVLTTDCYYSEDKIRMLLSDFGLDFFDELFVSCEKNVLKTNGLFELLEEYGKGSKILHIGDDEWADIEKAKEAGIETFKIYSGRELFEALGMLGAESSIKSLTDRIRAGLFIERVFSNPFKFENENERVVLDNASDVGYSLLSPVIIDFMLWMIEEANREKMDNILLCARDGYIPEKIYNRLTDDKKALYFLTSRIAALRAGIKDKSDIEYVDSMNFTGTDKESMLARFGIDIGDGEMPNRDELILKKAEESRRNYRKYVESLNLGNGTLGVFDFVAKGTTQYFLQKLLKQQLKGLYFLQLEPEFMADKGVEIKSFYEEKERETSAIFNYFYVLEAILTSNDPTVNEFDGSGRPIFSKETRSGESLECIEAIWRGIYEYLDDYISLLPKKLRAVNKALDEAFLSLVGKIDIRDNGFNNLVLEDPFFGRNTPIKDVL